jgi:translation initiation factor 3 subunit C
MLLEVPNMAASGFDTKKKIISRPFRRLLDYFERQVFTGPPETTRDVIITAAKALNKGNWKRSEELLLGLSVWNLLPKPDKVKEMLKRYLL